MIRKKPVTPDAAKIKMADICAKSEHCEYEIKNKLIKMGLCSGDIAEIIEFLLEERFIDNTRYAKSFVNDKVRFAGWGRNKIKQHLYLKRIPRECINEACLNIDEEVYLDSLYKVASQKARSYDLSQYEEKAKLYRYLLSRGFEASFISKTIHRLIRESEE